MQEAFVRAKQILPTYPEFTNTAQRIWVTSEFVLNACQQNPAMVHSLFDSGDMLRAYTVAEWLDRLSYVVQAMTTEEELQVQLRLFRTREMVRIAWRSLSGWAVVEETMQELSAFADACLQVVSQWLYRIACHTEGVPYDKFGMPQTLCIIAVGKLGGGELNFSSDIDLIFCYPEQGYTRGGSRVLSNEQFFIRLGQSLIRMLSHISERGFVFRVDMRLRPYGSTGPIAIGFPAFKQYYRHEGRDWERYALIKARVIAGDRLTANQIDAVIQRFVYRHYLDYEMLTPLRDMLAKMRKEVRAKRLGKDIKRMRGGIRDIEFIVQTFQLVRGGMQHGLSVQGTLAALRVLGKLRCLPEVVIADLRRAYLFYRRVEHCLQMMHDQQNYRLPQRKLAKMQLAFAMGYVDWTSFEEEISLHKNKVRIHFKALIVRSHSQWHENEQLEEWKTLWHTSSENKELAITILNKAGYKQPTEILVLLKAFQAIDAWKLLNHRQRGRVDVIMPVLLILTAQVASPEVCFKRVISVMEAVLAEPVYLTLLQENPDAQNYLVRLCAESPWIASQLINLPFLLDELCRSETLQTAADSETLADELSLYLQYVKEGDLPEKMRSLREFKCAQVFRVAISEITDALPLMKACDHLSYTADVVLKRALDISFRNLVKQYGYPKDAKGRLCRHGFLILAYGKLGGLELSYDSDLDLVFLHENFPPKAETSGPESIPVSLFYAQLGQQLIHLLSSPTHTGILYDVDTRLRPSGTAGLLVTSFATFAEYQEETAWTWEHQALTRARVVNEDSILTSAFYQLREAILTKPRDAILLKKEVTEMRYKMRSAHKIIPKEFFDLKQGIGGITDIEFIVQYGVLRWAREHRLLLRYTDNIRILEAMGEAKLLSTEVVCLLSDAYRAYRASVHRLVLEERSPWVDDTEFQTYRAGVKATWQSLLET